MEDIVERSNELSRLEDIISKGRASFVEVGEALADIRDRKLYRDAGHKTFDAYCIGVWRFKAAYARRQIAAAEQVKSAPNGAVLPKTEGEARAQRKQAKPVIDTTSRPVQLTIPWAVPHSQDAARLAHDDIAAKLGVGAAKSFLRDEMTRLSKGALAPSEKPAPTMVDVGVDPLTCDHPKTAFNGNYHKCVVCGVVVPKKVGSK